MSAAERAEPLTEAEIAALFSGWKDVPSLVLAVSGGPDSTALMVAAARWRKALARGPELLAVTIDHGLRPQARAEAAAVKRLAGRLGIAHRTLRWTGAKPKTGLQAAARQARYRLLATAAAEIGARHILTAHTRDDQAETLLLRMARGSGLTGLAGMARVTPLPGRREGEFALVRPFLDIPKARLVATLEDAGIPYVEDASNRDPRFTRVRIRALMPALAAEGLDARRLAQLARRIRRAEAALEAEVSAAFAALSRTPSGETGRIVLDRSGFARMSEEIALRLLGRAIVATGDEGPVELAKLEALHAALMAALAAPKGAKARFRRTLAGALATLTDEFLTIERAPARRRAIKSGRKGLDHGPVSLPQSGQNALT